MIYKIAVSLKMHNVIFKEIEYYRVAQMLDSLYEKAP